METKGPAAFKYKVEGSSNAGLTLFSEKGKRLTVEAEKFPTNARKDFKIKANKTAKFDKACEKILARLSGVTPDIIG